MPTAQNAKSKFWIVCICAVCALAMILLAIYNDSHPTTAPALTSVLPPKANAYDRVIKTSTLHCGYALWSPLVIKDPNTGKLSGIEVDYLEAVGNALHLKIDWSEEIGWGDFPAALNTGRIDGFCAGVWPNAARGREVDFTQPIIYQPVYAYVRNDDLRFDRNLDAANDPSITIVTIDGEIGSLIKAADFQNAKALELTQMTSAADALTSVATHKGDLFFTDPETARDFDAQNPGTLRKVELDQPVRVFGNTIAVGHGQEELRRMLDAATDELLSSGRIDKIVAHYKVTPGSMLRVAFPYDTNVPVIPLLVPPATPASVAPPTPAPDATLTPLGTTAPEGIVVPVGTSAP